MNSLFLYFIFNWSAFHVGTGNTLIKNNVEVLFNSFLFDPLMSDIGGCFGGVAKIFCNLRFTRCDTGPLVRGEEWHHKSKGGKKKKLAWESFWKFGKLTSVKIFPAVNGSLDWQYCCVMLSVFFWVTVFSIYFFSCYIFFFHVCSVQTRRLWLCPSLPVFIFPW